MLKCKKGDDDMKEKYLVSLQMIKILKIRKTKEYNRLHKYYKLLSINSLKYISQEKDFKKVVELANIIWNLLTGAILIFSKRCDIKLMQ